MAQLKIDTPDDYYTQRNNKIDPLGTCNDTSFAMGLDIVGYKDKFTSYLAGVYNKDSTWQLDDLLTCFFHDSEAINYRNSIDTDGSLSNTPPNEIHAVLEWGINLLFSRIGGTGNLVKFSTTWDSNNDFIPALRDGRPVILSGSYPCWSDLQNKIITIGHITILVGLNINPDNTVGSYIVDDPYGNPQSNYTDHNGYNVILTPDSWTNWVKEVGNPSTKWGHIFLQKAS